MASRSRREALRLYENKDYSGALAVLEEVLASAPPHDQLIATLDLRVSIYFKLEDNVSARKDATQMIRTNKADGRGYLRLGQLERLTGDHNAAIKWYEHGRKKVPESDRLHGYISAQHTKTMALLKGQAVLSNPTDPFMKLPAEMIEMIVRSFNYNEAAICLRVSKTWRQVVSSLSVLRNTIDFSNVGKGQLVAFSGIKAALRRSQQAERPILVVAKNLTQPAARHLKETMERCIHYTEMQHLEIDCPVNPDLPSNIDFQRLPWHRFQLRTLTFGLEHIIFIDTIYQILQSCDALQKAIFLSVEPSSVDHALAQDPWVRSTAVSSPNLKTLSIHGSRRPGAYSRFVIPFTFFSRFSNLQHLTLTGLFMDNHTSQFIPMDLSSLKSLQSLNCSKSALAGWLILPASLEIIDWTDFVAHKPRPTIADAIPVKKLRVARLAGCTCDSRILGSIIKLEYSALSYLDVDFETNKTSPDSWPVFLNVLRSGGLKELTYLRIWYAMLSDSHIDDLVANCCKLETVELSSPRMTGVFVVGLLTAPGSQVKRLVLKNCSKVSPDTDQWARQRGVVVERTNSEGSRRSGRSLYGLA